jgi:hypothetical protein
MTMNNLDEPPKKKRSQLAFFAFAGIAFIAFGILIIISGIELEPGDAALNIIGGLLLLAAIPFMLLKKGKK